MKILMLVMEVWQGGIMYVRGQQPTTIVIVGSPEEAAVALWDKRNSVERGHVEATSVRATLYQVDTDSLAVREVSIPQVRFDGHGNGGE